MIGLLLSCGEPAIVERAPEGLLSGPALARRISFDLRGIPPSLAELESAEASDDAVWALRDAWLEDERLEDRLVALLAERWLTRVDSFNVEETDYYFTGPDALAFTRAVGEEPLRLMARVVVEDRPWTEIVTADYTRALPVLAEVFPLDREDGEGWQTAWYTDGRPAAGVLATNGLWWRYTTTFSNLNRARVAAMSDLLLCQDMLSRPISFSGVGALLQEGSDDAVLTEDVCISCHAAIEPLAASLFGFWWTVQYNAAEMSIYHPEREAMGPEVMGVDLEYFGTPVAGLADVGRVISDDPRFWRCGAQSTAELLWRRPVTTADFARITELTTGFVSSGGNMKALLAATMQTPEYRDLAPRLLAPDQLSGAVESLTGYTWMSEGHDLLDQDIWGFRVLAGGVDGELVTAPQSVPGLTWALTVERLAQAAAGNAIQSGLFSGTPDEQSLIDLHRLALSRSPTDAELADLLALWSEVEAAVSPEAAWRVVLGVLIRDPEFVSR